jgi:two-component system, chemotaxis family, chemotaxis protein CheY
MVAEVSNSIPRDLTSVCVMVVEDQPFVRDLLERLLTSLSIPKVASARSAEEALETLESDPDLVDVLIADFELPGMTGLSFIEKLRASKHRKLRELPAVMLTGHNDLALYRDAARVGISAFLVKPAGPGTLKAAVQEALSGRKLAVPRAGETEPDKAP